MTLIASSSPETALPLASSAATSPLGFLIAGRNCAVGRVSRLVRRVLSLGRMGPTWPRLRHDFYCVVLAGHCFAISLVVATSPLIFLPRRPPTTPLATSTSPAALSRSAIWLHRSRRVMTLPSPSTAAVVSRDVGVRDAGRR